MMTGSVIAASLLLRTSAVLLLVLAVAPGIVYPKTRRDFAFQTAQASLQERLNRAGSELAGGTARVPQIIDELKEILAVDPRSPQAHLLLGIAYRMTGSPDLIGEAVAELRQAIAIEPRLVAARFYLAQVYLDLGRAGRARGELQAALVEQPGHPQFLALLGEAERQLNNPRRSVELCRQALQADAGFSQARYYLGLALFDLGEREAAITELEQLVRAGVREVDLLSTLGAAYIEGGRLDEALTVLSEGTQLAPARPDLRIQLSRTYRLKGRLDSAAEQLESATPASIQALASGVQQQQVEFDLQIERGWLAMARQRPAAAVEAFRAALTMDPNHGPAHRGLAEAYMQQGLHKLALGHAARAEKLGHPLPDAARKRLRDAIAGSVPDKQK